MWMSVCVCVCLQCALLLCRCGCNDVRCSQGSKQVQHAIDKQHMKTSCFCGSQRDDDNVEISDPICTRKKIRQNYSTLEIWAISVT